MTPEELLSQGPLAPEELLASNAPVVESNGPPSREDPRTIVDMLLKVSPNRTEQDLNRQVALGMTEEELRLGAYNLHKAYLDKAAEDFQKEVVAGNAANAAQIITGMSAAKDYTPLRNRASVVSGAVGKQLNNQEIDPTVAKDTIVDFTNREAIGSYVSEKSEEKFGQSTFTNLTLGFLSNIAQNVVTLGIPYWVDSFTVVQDAIAKHTPLKRRVFAHDAVEDFRQYIGTLTADDRYKVVKAVVADGLSKMSVLGDDAKKVQALAIMSKLGDSTLDNEAWQAVDAAFGVLDATAITGVANGMYKYSRLKKNVVGPRATGEDVAARVNNGTIDENNVPAGMTVEDTARAANAADISHFVEGGLSGASAPIQEKIMSDAGKLIERLTTGLDNNNITYHEADMLRAEAERTSHLPNPEIAAHTTAPIGDQVVTTLQHPSGAPYASREAAQDTADRVGGIVVEAKASTTQIPTARSTFTNETLPTEFDTGGKTGKFRASDRPATVNPEIDEVFLGTKMEMESLSGKKAMAEVPVDMVMEIIGRSADKVNARIAQLLGKFGGAKKMNIIEVGSVDEYMMVLRKAEPESYAKLTTKAERQKAYDTLGGFYSPDTDTIYIKSAHRSNEGLVLHEVAHARAVQVLALATQYDLKGALKAGLTEVQWRAAREIDSIYKQVFEKMRDHTIPLKDDVYGLQNVHEFLSEALGNRTFQNALNHMTLDKSTARKVWDALAEALSKLLGFELKDKDVLAQVFQASDDLFRGQTEAQRKALQTAIKKGITDQEGAETTLNFSRNAPDELSHGFYVQKTFNRYADEDINSVQGFAIDPLHGSSRQAVEEALRSVVYDVAKTTDDLLKFITKYTSPMKHKELKLLDDILTEGDAYSRMGGVGKEFNHGELLVKTSHLDPDAQNRVIEGYFAFRTLNNVMYHVRNQAAIAEATRRGLTQYTLNVANGATFASIGKSKTFTSHINEFAYDLASGREVLITSANAPMYDAAGNTLISLSRRFDAPNGKAYQHVIGNATTHRAGPVTSVIPYRPGEFRRIYKDEYFIRLHDKTVLDGKAKDTLNTVHTARSAKDADNYVQGFQQLLKEWRANPAAVTVARVEALLKRADDPRQVLADLAAGKYDNVSFVSKSYSREDDDYVRLFENVQTGGPFNAERGPHVTPVDNPHRLNTLPVYKSVQAEIINTARTRSVTQWRDQQILEWADTARHFDAFKGTELDGITDPFELFHRATNFTNYNGQDKLKTFLANTHAYIQKQIGVKTNEEVWVEGKLRLLTESAERFLGVSLMKQPMELAGRVIRQGNWNSWLRAYNMHNFFGLNPAQLLVQGWGASTAMAISPIHGSFAAKEAALLIPALMSDNPAVWEKLYKVHNVASLGLGSKQDFLDTIRIVNETGMLKGISATSMHNVEAGVYNILSPTARRAQAASLFFFNRGQEFSQLTAFGTARREWQQGHPGMAWTDPAAIRDIMIRTDDLTQNMTRANQARWQQGLLAIPTQFMQYQLKLGQNIIGAYSTLAKQVRYGAAGNPYRGFTAGEATKILAMNVVALGTAGMGLQHFVGEWLGEQMDINQLSKDQRLFLVEGALAGLLNEASQMAGLGDARVAVGTRLGVLNWYSDTAVALSEGSGEFWKVLLGVSAGSLSRLGAIGNVLEGWRYSPDVTAQDIIEGIAEVAREQPSSLRNGWKWWLLHNNEGVLQAKDGRPIAHLSEMEALAKGLGFQSAAEADVSRLYKAEKSLKGDIQDMVEIATKLNVERIRALKNGDQATADKRSKALAAIYSASYNSGGQEEFSKMMSQRNKYSSDLERMITEYLTEMNDKKLKVPVVNTTPTKEGR